jgi:hypothetical protein
VFPFSEFRLIAITGEKLPILSQDFMGRSEARPALCAATFAQRSIYSIEYAAFPLIAADQMRKDLSGG